MTAEPHATIGDNSVINSDAQTMIRSTVERVERLNADKAAINEDLKEVFAEAKGNGLAPAILRKVVKRRAMDAAKRQEEDALLDLYMRAANGELF